MWITKKRTPLLRFKVPRRRDSVHAFANAVDDVVQLLRCLRIFSDTTFQCEGTCAEETPCRGIAPVMLRMLPLREHFRHAVDVDHSFLEHAHDCRIGCVIVEVGFLVREHLAMLHLALVCEWLHDLGNECGEFMLGACGVLALHDVIGDECQVVADECPRAKADADGELLVVAVAHDDRVFVVAIRALE